MQIMHVIGQVIDWVCGHFTKKRSKSADQMVQYFTNDIPITKADDDLLGRKEFSTALATVLYRHKSEESLIVALQGGWGSGKTSIKNLVLENLRSRPEGPMTTVDFNPWQWSSDEATTRAFFREIAAALGDVEKSKEGLLRTYEFEKYANRIQTAAAGLKSVAGQSDKIVGWLASFALIAAGLGFAVPQWPITKLASILLIVSGILSAAGKIVAWRFKVHDDDRPLEIIQESLKKRLRTLSRNLLIVIDDIDRLEPEQIRDVIRTVKANASLPGLTYLLLYQRDVVVTAFNPISNGQGAEYLEKIVQRSFDVPTVEGERIIRVLTNGLDLILSPFVSEHPRFQTVRWGNLFSGGIRHFFHTLRDVRRYLGAIELQALLHAEDRVFELDILDMLALEALRVFEPEVYGALARSKNLLLAFREGDQRDKEQLKSLLSGAREGNKNAVERIARELFPRMEWAFANILYADGFHQKWVNERRICSSRHFDKYFALRLPDGQISESDFGEFLATANSRDFLMASFENFRARGLLEDLLSRLDESTKTLPRDIVSSLVPALFDIGDTIPDQVGFTIESPFINCWRTAVWLLRREPDQTRRSKLFLASLRDSNGVAAPAVIIDIDRKAREDRDDISELIMSDEELEIAKSIWCEKIDRLTQTPEQLIQCPFFVSLLLRWQNYVGKERVREWMTSAVHNPTLLRLMLVAFMTESQSYSAGDAVAQRTKQFGLRYLESLFSVQEFANSVTDLEDAELDTYQREAKEAFLSALAKWKPGGPESTDEE